MAPFGPYRHMSDCVAKNSDKKSPGGYCATIHKKITGEYPKRGKHGEEYDPDAEIITFAEGFVPWVNVSMFAEGNMTLKTIDVFRTGTHVDSAGVSRDWSTTDLNNMVRAFDAGVPGRVPIKVGHTSDAFNQSLADKLGLPPEILVGEDGDGAASLGRITKLRVDGDVLRADVEMSPPLSRLIDDKLFSDVSSEIFSTRIGSDGTQYGPVLSALAVLGAERPAVKDLVAFSTKVDGKPADMVLTFKISDAPSTTTVHRFDVADTMNHYFVHVSEIGTGAVDTLDVAADSEDEARTIAEDLLTKMDGMWSVDSVEIVGPILQREPGVIGVGASSSVFREAVLNQLGPAFVLNHEAALNNAESVIDAAMKDALITGTIQRTGVGNIIRSVWDIFKGTVHRGFREQGANDVPQPVVAALSFPNKSESEIKSWLKSHKYRDGVWTIDGASNVARPSAYRFNPSLRYKRIDVGGGITAIIGMQPIKQDPQKLKEGDIPMATELELRNALGIPRNVDLLEGARAIAGRAKFSEQQAETLKRLDHRDRVSKYAASTRDLVGIPGTPLELAEKLATIEERFGEPDAKELLATWQGVHKAVEQAGVLSRFTQPTDKAGEVEGDKLIATIARERKVSVPEAMVIFSREQPDKFREYKEQKRAG